MGLPQAFPHNPLATAGAPPAAASPRKPPAPEITSSWPDSESLCLPPSEAGGARGACLGPHSGFAVLPRLPLVAVVFACHSLAGCLLAQMPLTLWPLTVPPSSSTLCCCRWPAAASACEAQGTCPQPTARPVVAAVTFPRLWSEDGTSPGTRGRGRGQAAGAGQATGTLA